jgi:hypothetical protein
VSALLVEHFPSTASTESPRVNELPDEPFLG